MICVRVGDDLRDGLNVHHFRGDGTRRRGSEYDIVFWQCCRPTAEPR